MAAAIHVTLAHLECVERTVPDDYDSPWKEAIERYFPDFMHFYFPAAHARIDWNQPYLFLDQELRSVVHDIVDNRA